MVMDLAKSFFEKPGELLLIGLGGGSMIKNFAKDGWKVDAVEIDPTVIRVAQEHLDWNLPKAMSFRWMAANICWRRRKIMRSLRWTRLAAARFPSIW
jgi:16S rRNA A1518/A1519 N6-dimethyltransferase RsmA/KsgA/DIM1 with predicted DNA glycosylase/AP lyase activity